MPCIADFSLSGKQWANFSGFFYDKNTYDKYLDSETINKDNYPQKYFVHDSSDSHVVVLIENSEKGLTFLNSWGIRFGDYGKFRIKNSDVLTDGNPPYRKIKYYLIFWYINDLSEEEKNYYNENHKKYVSKSLRYLINSKNEIDKLKKIKSPCKNCSYYSELPKYKGNILYVKCPKCSKIFIPNDENLKNFLYLREILPAEENNILNNNENENLRAQIIEEVNAKRINESNTKIELICNDFENSVNSLIILSDKRLCACSSDSSIKIYKLNGGNSFNLEIDKKGAHSKEILCIKEINYLIIASGSYKNIKIWKIEDNNLYSILLLNNAHNDYINKIIIFNNNFVSCSKDGTIKFWNEKYQEKLKIDEHNGCINSILKIKRKNILVSGSNSTLIFWKIQNNKFNLIKKYDNIFTSNNNSLIEIKDTLLVGGKDGINIFSTKDGNIMKYDFVEDKDLGSVLSFYDLGNNMILIGSDNGFIYLYKLERKLYDIQLKNINVIRNNPKALKGRTKYSINSLTLYSENNEFYILVGSADKTINIYKYIFNPLIL